MFNRLFSVMLTLVGISLFVLIPIISDTHVASKQISEILLSEYVTPATIGETVGEDYVKGSDIVSLAYKSINGDIVLVIDTVQIMSEEDLSTVNLGLVGSRRYDVTKTYSPVLNKDVIVARVRW